MLAGDENDKCTWCLGVSRSKGSLAAWSRRENCGPEPPLRSCFSLDDSKRLPASVFKCDKADDKKDTTKDIKDNETKDSGKKKATKMSKKAVKSAMKDTQ